ncbi:MAG TPA: HRDC domain-containing protein, partial [Candidatus Eisenbacteria bacterium]|nr:HRDC domain-containing protein [Candidatus Eisenbacteria bacterium]
EYPVLELTHQGRLVLAGQAPAEVTLPAPAQVVRAGAAARAQPDAPAAPADPRLLERLRTWRLEVSRAQGVPAYVVFHDRTLAEIAARSPRDLAELEQVSGVGPAKLERYGEQVLAVLDGTRRP